MAEDTPKQDPTNPDTPLPQPTAPDPADQPAAPEGGAGGAVDPKAAPAAGDPKAAPAAGDPKPNLRADIDQLAATMGLEPGDLADFPDLPSATAAIRMQAESFARIGYGQEQQPDRRQTQEPAPAPGAPEPIKPLDLAALGLEEDAESVKAIRALEERHGQAMAAITELSQQFEQAEVARSEQVRAANQREAREIMSSWQDPKYGTIGNQTTAQRMAEEALYSMANSVLYGVTQAGKDAPSVPARMNQARLLLASGAPPSVVEPPADTKKAALTSAAPARPGDAAKVGLHGLWSEDPEMRRLLKLA